MILEAYKKKAIDLLGSYRKRETAIRLLQVELQAMEQLAPSIGAVSYQQMAAHTNKVSKPTEGEVLRREQRPQQLEDLRNKIVLLRLQNQKIDLILESLADPYRTLLRLKYVKALPWAVVCQQCTGYSEDYVRKNLNARALQMFVSLYYPETNQVGLFDGCQCESW